MYQQHNGPCLNSGSSPLNGSTRSNMMQSGDIHPINIVKEISELKESASNLFTVPDALENLQETVSVMQDNVDALRKDVKKILAILTAKNTVDKSLLVSKASPVVPAVTDVPVIRPTQAPTTEKPINKFTPGFVPRSFEESVDVPDEATNHHMDYNAYNAVPINAQHVQPVYRLTEDSHIEHQDATVSTNDQSIDSTLSVFNENPSMPTTTVYEDVSLMRYRRKKTDMNSDNRIAFFFDDAEVQLNSLEPSRKVPESEHQKQPSSFQEPSELENKQSETKSRLRSISESGSTPDKVAEVKPVVKTKRLDNEQTDVKSAVSFSQPGARSTEQQNKGESSPLEPTTQSNNELPRETESSHPTLGAVAPFSSNNTQQITEVPNSASLDDAIPMLEEMTLKEAAKAGDCSDPKSQGADTIICVDTSESMTGEPIEQAKTFITEFLNGIEEAAVDYGLEENIAIVTFGHENKVVQNLTNDYGKIRDAVDDIKTGGPSPMMTGLVLCLSAIFNRGGVVTYRERKIQPRILLISDGKATDERVLEGPDVISPPSSVARVHGKLTEFAERLKTEPRIVYCIPVGEADETIMKPISETTGGTIINPSKAIYISRHFLLNTITAKIKTSGIFDENDGYPERSTLEEMAKDQLKDMADQHLVNEVLRMVDEDVTRSRAEMATNASRNQKEADLLKNIPPVGTRVRRGRDWKWDFVDDDGPGTITAHKGKGWVTVEWDGGNKGKYRYGAEAAMDVQPVDEPRYLSEGEMAAVGVRVRRGPDWEWGNQDGGERSTGVIFKIEDSGIVHVRWDNGKRGNYRFGLFGKFDVEICFGSESQTSNQNEELLGATAATATSTVRQTRPQWQWKDNETNQWHDHPRSDSDRIEALHKKGKGTILVTCNGQSFRVVPQNLQQRNTGNGTTNEIRRKEIPIG